MLIGICNLWHLCGLASLQFTSVVVVVVVVCHCVATCAVTTPSTTSLPSSLLCCIVIVGSLNSNMLGGSVMPNPSA